MIDLGSGSESDNESELGRVCIVNLTELAGFTYVLWHRHRPAYIEEARQIRREQDEAYQQSLEADKAKAKAERELQDI